MKRTTESPKSVTLPEKLRFASDYSCYNCKYMNGGEGSKIWCEYYKGYYDPCYCDHFVSKF